MCFLAHLEESGKSYCTISSVGVAVSKMLKFLLFMLKVFYVMGKALSGELSCPCDRSCCIKHFNPRLLLYLDLGYYMWFCIKHCNTRLLLSERLKLHTILVFLSAIGLKMRFG